MPFMIMFQDCIQPKHGFFHRLPFNGSLTEQPAITLEILKIIKFCYIEFLREGQSEK
jgi:hypothetical protein